LPLYAASIEDLGPGDFVKVDCSACGHTGCSSAKRTDWRSRAKLAPPFLSRLGLRLRDTVLDPQRRGLPFWVFGAGTFSTAATTRLLSGLAVLRPGLVGSPRPPNVGLVGLERRRGSRPLGLSACLELGRRCSVTGLSAGANWAELH
jgi:hypothetical protein